MKSLAMQSYTIAWFKIADFVARGEKERALHVYRLLMHSVSDPALSYQLEGDILLAFDDDAALDRYHVAANLYKKSGKLPQAISVYEHVGLFREDEKILEALLDIYVSIKHRSGMLNAFSRLAKYGLKQGKKDFVVQVIHRCSMDLDDSLQAQLYARFVRSLLLYDEKAEDLLQHVEQAIDLFLHLIADHREDNLNQRDERMLQTFLTDLHVLDDNAHQHAKKYVAQAVIV